MEEQLVYQKERNVHDVIVSDVIAPLESIAEQEQPSKQVNNNNNIGGEFVTSPPYTAPQTPILDPTSPPFFQLSNDATVRFQPSLHDVTDHPGNVEYSAAS